VTFLVKVCKARRLSLLSVKLDVFVEAIAIALYTPLWQWPSTPNATQKSPKNVW
jgi:hypothetical protein